MNFICPARKSIKFAAKFHPRKIQVFWHRFNGSEVKYTGDVTADALRCQLPKQVWSLVVAPKKSKTGRTVAVAVPKSGEKGPCSQNGRY